MSLRTAVTRSLVVPMFCEEGRVEATIRQIAGSPLDDPGTELVFVDDGSHDDTAVVTEKALSNIGLEASVIRLERNVGKGGAVRAGVLASRGAVVAFADADLSAGIDEIVECFRLVERGQADIALATRAHRDSVITDPQPRLRQLSGKAFNVLLRALGLTGFADTQCGLKAFTRESAVALFGDLRTTGFAFDVELLLRARERGYRAAELPIAWRHVEESRVRPVRDSAGMMRDVIALRFGVSRESRRRRRAAGSAASMSDETFDVMSRLERDHWWFRAKRELVAQELERVGALASGPALDVGCGTGETVRRLGRLGAGPVIGTDASHYAVRLASSGAEPASSFVVTRAEALPFRSSSLGCLVSLDVVEHIDDDVGAVREFARVLAPDGALVLAVPAYPWAWSDHDVALGHKRRYVAPHLRRVTEAGGFEVSRCTYYHSWLVPVAFLLRKTPLRRLVKGPAEEASFVSPAVNRAFGLATALERRLLHRLDLPFGLSILLVGRHRRRPG